MVVFLHLFTHPGFVWRLIVDAISYLVFQGAYSHVMVIFAFCNIDDVSWGTKGVRSIGPKKYSVEKVFFMANWLFWNAVVAFIFILIDFYIPRKSRKGYVLIGMGIYATAYLTIKTLMAIFYHFKFYVGKVCCGCVRRKA